MNEPRISSLEKDVEILKVTINPLLEKMDKNTEATINLTSKVGFMLEKFDKVEENQKDQEDRLIDLEKKDYAAQSGRDLIRHFKFALITLLCGGIISGIVFVIGLYSERA